MKQFKKFNILTLIIMVILLNTAFVFVPKYPTMKTPVSKPIKMVSKNKMLNNLKQKTSKTIKVKITNFAFDQKNITINKGDTVIWTNLDSMAHTVTGSTFDSGNLNMNATFKYTFKTAGTFNYVCTYHSKMTGTVVVK